jgi:hypothetical protein
MNGKLDAMTDQEIADAVQNAVERAIRMATSAQRRACAAAAVNPGIAGPVAASAAKGLGALWQAHGHFTDAALAMPGIKPQFGGK